MSMREDTQRRSHRWRLNRSSNGAPFGHPHPLTVSFWAVPQRLRRPGLRRLQGSGPDPKGPRQRRLGPSLRTHGRKIIGHTAVRYLLGDIGKGRGGGGGEGREGREGRGEGPQEREGGRGGREGREGGEGSAAMMLSNRPREQRKSGRGVGLIAHRQRRRRRRRQRQGRR